MSGLKDNFIIEEIDKIAKKISEKTNKNRIFEFLKEKVNLLFTNVKKETIEQEMIEIDILSKSDLRVRRAKNQRLRTLAVPYMKNISLSLFNIPHTIMLTDNEGYILDIIAEKNHCWEDKYVFVEGACWSEECIGRNGIGTAIKTDEPVLIYGYEHKGKELCNLACYGVPIHDSHEKLIGVLAITVPTGNMIPDKFSLALLSVSSIETALKQIVVDEAEDRIKKMSSIVATAVHDLKNPLSIIQALTGIGLKRTKSEKVKDCFIRINKQIKQLTDLMNNIMLVSEPEEFKMLLPGSIIIDLVEQLRPVAESKGIKINLYIKATIKLNLRKKVFSRAIHNILINSIDNMSQGGNINVSIKEKYDHIIIIIEDDGPGIPEDIRSSLFQPFISRKKGGTGLGLYMVYQTITQVHQGDIWFDTAENDGTTFYITIPFAELCII
ncbi:MAG: ATP-binding protein [Halanaerobiaceae bacterium]